MLFRLLETYWIEGWRERSQGKEIREEALSPPDRYVQFALVYSEQEMDV